MQPWNGLLIVLVIFASCWLIASLTASFQEKRLVKSGMLPPVEQTTDADIVRIAKSGYKVWAIKRYRQIHQVSLKDAKHQVESLLR